MRPSLPETVRALQVLVSAGRLACLADSSSFLSVDSWNDLSAAKMIYGSASFQQAFGALFAGPPTWD